MDKKPWTRPALELLGTVETLTRADKRFGAGDSFTFENQPTVVVSH